MTFLRIISHNCMEPTIIAIKIKIKKNGTQPVKGYSCDP